MTQLSTDRRNVTFVFVKEVDVGVALPEGVVLLEELRLRLTRCFVGPGGRKEGDAEAVRGNEVNGAMGVHLASPKLPAAPDVEPHEDPVLVVDGVVGGDLDLVFVIVVVAEEVAGRFEILVVLLVEAGLPLEMALVVVGVVVDKDGA